MRLQAPWLSLHIGRWLFIGVSSLPAVDIPLIACVYVCSAHVCECVLVPWVALLVRTFTIIRSVRFTLTNRFEHDLYTLADRLKIKVTAEIDAVQKMFFWSLLNFSGLSYRMVFTRLTTGIFQWFCATTWTPHVRATKGSLLRLWFTQFIYS